MMERKNEIRRSGRRRGGGQAEGKMCAIWSSEDIEDGGVDEQVDGRRAAEAGEDGAEECNIRIFSLVPEVDGASQPS